jgi:hypothetical protein
MKMKKKLFIPLIAALLTIGLTSVGFAAWVITGTTTDVANGDFTVYEVEDQRYSFTATVTNGTVIWGKDSTTQKWLQTKGAHDNEHLKIAVVLAAATDEEDHHGKTVLYSVTTAVTDNTAKAWKAASEANYVAAPTDKSYKVTYDASGDPTKVTDGNGGTLAAEDYVISGSNVTIYVEFDWGTFTGGSNPYAYFNTTFTDAGQEWKGAGTHVTAGDAAYAMLKAIEALTGVEYVATVSGTIQ